MGHDGLRYNSTLPRVSHFLPYLGHFLQLPSSIFARELDGKKCNFKDRRATENVLPVAVILYCYPKSPCFK